MNDCDYDDEYDYWDDKRHQVDLARNRAFDALISSHPDEWNELLEEHRRRLTIEDERREHAKTLQKLESAAKQLKRQLEAEQAAHQRTRAKIAELNKRIQELGDANVPALLETIDKLSDQLTQERKARLALRTRKKP